MVVCVAGVTEVKSDMFCAWSGLCIEAERKERARRIKDRTENELRLKKK